MEKILVTMICALLLIHEMDAIRLREWKLFILLRDMKDETAYRIFTILHLPLYMLILYMVFYGNATASALWKGIIDLFLIGHGILHFGFRKHKENGFTSLFSKSIIYIMPVLAVLHFVCF